jgi:oligopeptide transport system permease protein
VAPDVTRVLPAEPVRPVGRRRHVSPRAALAAIILGGLTLMALVPQAFTRQDPASCRLSESLAPPSRGHLFGYDLQGCDQLAVTVHGTRSTFTVAVLVIVTSSAIALVLGSIAAWAGGRVDAVVARLTEVWAGVPLALGGVVVLSATDRRGPLQLALVLSVFAWPPLVRVLRASVMAERQREHVLAARALGASTARVVVRHVLPGSLRPLVVLATAYAGVVVAAEATLTFAGVGLARPTQSWGLQLADAEARMLTSPHLLLPGLFVVAAVAGFVLLGEELRARGRDKVY